MHPFNNRFPRTLKNVAVATLLTIHASLLAWGAAVHSPTLNEPGHLVAGISYWTFNRFDVYSVNPPLVRLVAALPVMAAGCETDWKSFASGPGVRPEMAMGRDFCKANGRRTFWLMTLARWACIPFSLIGGIACYRWSRELYGQAGGFLSLTLWCFCPMVLGHGQLITSDVAAAGLGLVACHSFWRWLKAPTWSNAAVSGVLLGLAELAKTTLLVFLPLWPLLWLAWRLPERARTSPRQWAKEAGMLLLRFALAFYTINFGYAFEDCLPKLGSFTFVSRSLSGNDAPDAAPRGNRFTGTWLAELPIPLPRNYIVGIDLQRRDFEDYHHEFYLAGTWSKTGWWYYYLYGLAIKLPLGTWVLLGIAALARAFLPPRVRFRDEFTLLVPPLAIFGFVSSQTGMNEHVRYVLPVLPFFYIWIGRLGPALHPALAGMGSGTKQIAAPIGETLRPMYGGGLAALSLAWAVSSSLLTVPHSLAYFNESVGGRHNGWRYLVSSNSDWGQDLIYLERFIQSHPEAEGMPVAYYGPFEPPDVGLSCRPMRREDADVLLAMLDWTDPPERFRGPWAYYAVGTTPAVGQVTDIIPRPLTARLINTKPFTVVGDAMAIYRFHDPRPLSP